MKKWVDKYKQKKKARKGNVVFIFDKREYDIDKQCDETYYRFLDKIISFFYMFGLIQFTIGFFGIWRDYVQTLF